jgi:glycine/D-amino acid oxidase-like deaminating enzyme
LSVQRVAEIVIAGAGMAGIAAAYQLAVRARAAGVVLLDSREPLSLTSRRGTEAYRNHWPGPDAAMRRLMDRSIDLLDEIDRESGHAFELNRRGYVYLTADPIEAGRLRADAGDVADFVAAPGEIRARYPFVTHRACAMLHVRRAGFMNASKLGHWLLERALANGVELVRDEVTALDISRGRVSGVRLASGSRIDTRLFVLATGPLLSRWCERLGIHTPLVNELHGKISFEDEAGVIPRDAPLMIWNDAVDLGERGRFPAGVHFRPRGDRSILGLWAYDTRVEEPRFPPSFAHDYADVVLRGLSVMVPGLSVYAGRSPTAVVDGGYYCKAPDNRPLVGPTAMEGAYVLGALSGFGIMASQAAAELLAAGMLGQALPEYAGAFHPARFDDPDYQALLATADSTRGQL